MIVRELTTNAEFQECLQLQREGFGWSAVDLMPVRFFTVSGHIGGLVLGAFEDETLVGFLSAIPGIRNGTPYWHSHMLAVTKSRRDAGIGAALKERQKEEALARGIQRIEWTFDPLESRNAYFNIRKLGAIVRQYYPDFYGPGIDRVIAEWLFDRPRPPIQDETRRLTIPAASEAAKEERMRVRLEFLQHLGDGFLAAGFERRGKSSDYIFVRGEPDADHAG